MSENYNRSRSFVKTTFSNIIQLEAYFGRKFGMSQYFDRNYKKLSIMYA